MPIIRWKLYELQSAKLWRAKIGFDNSIYFIGF